MAPEYQLVTTAASNTNHSIRHKHRIEDKVIYYIHTEEDANHSVLQMPLEFELRMIELARKAGIRCAASFSYSRHGQLEVAVIEYIQGTSSKDVDPKDVAVRLLEVIVKMEAVQRRQVVMYQHVLTGTKLVTFPSSQAFYRHLIRYIIRMSEFLIKQSIKINVALVDLLPMYEPTVLAHGDLHIGNVLITDAGETAVIDWEFVAFLPLSVARHMYCREPENVVLDLPYPSLVGTLVETYILCQRCQVQELESATGLPKLVAELGDLAEVVEQFSEKDYEDFRRTPIINQVFVVSADFDSAGDWSLTE